MVMRFLLFFWVFTFALDTRVYEQPQLDRKDITEQRQGDEDDQLKVGILAVNDVYELLPVGGLGGLARLSALRNKLLKKYDGKLITILAGDFYSPSALGSATVEIDGVKSRLNGKHIVDVFNRIPLDLVTFGNHEFDLQAADFYDRMKESNFTYVATNVFDGRTDKLFEKTVPFLVKQIDAARIGFVSLTLKNLYKPYVHVANFTQSIQLIKDQIELHRKDYDVLIAITHQLEKDDTIFLQLLGEEIPLLIGGHDHQNMLFFRGSEVTPWAAGAKADSNTRSAYVHEIVFDRVKGKKNAVKFRTINSHLEVIDEHFSHGEDKNIQDRCHYWIDLAFKGFEKAGFAPNAIVTDLPYPLNALSASVRAAPTELTKIIAESFAIPFPQSAVRVFNGGAIRIDDWISKGPLSQYDVIRILPFADYISLVAVKGWVLTKLLDQGQRNQDTGGYLHYDGVEKYQQDWRLTHNNSTITPNQDILVAINGFLLKGLEVNLGWFKLGAPGIREVDLTENNTTEIRLSVIRQLQLQFPLPKDGGEKKVLPQVNKKQVNK